MADAQVTSEVGFTDFGDQTIKNVQEIQLKTIVSDDDTSVSLGLGTDVGDNFIVATDSIVVLGETANRGNVGMGTATPRRTLDVLDASDPQLRLSRVDNANYVDIQTTAADNLLVEASHATSNYYIFRGPTNSYLVMQNNTTGDNDGSGTGLQMGVTGNVAYMWMRGTGSSGTLNIGAGGSGGLTMDADNNIVALEGSFQLKAEIAAPSAPADGDGGIFYVKTDGIPYYISDSTVETSLVGGLNSAPADETYSGITATFTAGEALSRGEVVYFKAADSKMWKAVATAAGTSRCVAMAAADIAADATGVFLLKGFLTDNGTFPAYTVAGVLYTPEAETVSENVPEQTAPDTDGDFVQVLGWAVTANTVYFNPDSTVIEVA